MAFIGISVFMEYTLHMESFPRPQKVEREETMKSGGPEQTISALLGEPVGFDEIDSTYYIESDSLQLSYTEDDGVFEIRNIEITEQGSGLGSRIVQTLSEYAESNGMDIIASNVKNEARGFWESQGFQEGSEPGEFFKAA